MNDPIEMLCKDCDALVLFVQPQTDEPTDDLMCVICGTAITFGGILLQDRRAA